MRGFTLVEVLVATTIGVLVVGSAGLVFGRSVVAWRTANVRLDQMFETEEALEKIGSDLRNSIGAGLFAGEPDRITCVTADGPLSLKRIGYALTTTENGSSLVRSERDFSESEPKSEKVLLSGVRAFSVSYGYRGERLSEIVWFPHWEQENEVPAVIRVDLELETPRAGVQTLRDEFWIPQGVLMEAPASKK